MQLLTCSFEYYIMNAKENKRSQSEPFVFLAFINERTVAKQTVECEARVLGVNVTRELHREADSRVRSTGSRVNIFGNYLTERTAGTLWQQQQKNYFR